MPSGPFAAAAPVRPQTPEPAGPFAAPEPAPAAGPSPVPQPAAEPPVTPSLAAAPGPDPKAAVPGPAQGANPFAAPAAPAAPVPPSVPAPSPAPSVPAPAVAAHLPADAGDNPYATPAEPNPYATPAATSAPTPAPAPDAHATGVRVRQEVLGEESRRAPDPEGFRAEYDDFVTRVAWGGTWARPGLDRRTRFLVTLTALTVGGHREELARYLRAALRDGVTADEIKETFLHTALYCGLPAADAAFAVAERVVAEEGGEAAGRAKDGPEA
ncbi:carboxymuconolactone decarboxylase family protein [Streptomyces syringium]|uniref:carboxymuconolactone decarboxylase family protein n=1 Tax=Streptomyces syringium TaxID=76729 RepID=UPI003AAA5028